MTVRQIRDGYRRQWSPTFDVSRWVTHEPRGWLAVGIRPVSEPSA